MRKKEHHWEYRYIGIEIACYDDQNMNLPYPIKLVEQPIPYPEAIPSKKDPWQGDGEKNRYVGEVLDWQW